MKKKCQLFLPGVFRREMKHESVQYIFRKSPDKEPRNKTYGKKDRDTWLLREGFVEKISHHRQPDQQNCYWADVGEKLQKIGLEQTNGGISRAI
jgi:hypothetical protein